jgi:hypothetical protein
VPTTASATLRVEATPGLAFGNGALFVRPGGGGAYTAVALTQAADGSLRADVPASALTPRGLDLYAEVQSPDGTTRRFPEVAPGLAPVFQPTRFDALPPTVTPPALAYSMVSFPGNLDPAAVTDVTDVFVDDYGAYDTRNWRVFRWNPAAGAYDEATVDLSGAPTPGTAYWLINRAGDPYTVGAGVSTEGGQPYALRLAPGWNQVGAPFAYDVPWIESDGTRGVDGAGDVQIPFFYDGVEYVPLDSPTLGGEDPVLLTGSGYFVFNPEPDSVTVRVVPREAGVAPAPASAPALAAGDGPPATARAQTTRPQTTRASATARKGRRQAARLRQGARDVARSAARSAARATDTTARTTRKGTRAMQADRRTTRRTAPTTRTTPGDDALMRGTRTGWRADGAAERRDFAVQVLATVPGEPLRDTQNFLGMAPDARPGFDRHDLVEAPGIGEFVRLTIHEDGRRLMQSYRPGRGDGQAWDLTLDAYVPSRGDAVPADVRFDVFGELPDDFGVYLLDLDRRILLASGDAPADLAATRLTASASEVQRLRVIVGTPDFARRHSDDIPLEQFETALEANYPNPFTRQTTIAYRLGEPQEVEITVYNVLGQRVRRLVTGRREAGPHTVQWDARDDLGQPVASGVYFYRIRAGDFVGTRRMTLVR